MAFNNSIDCYNDDLSKLLIKNNLTPPSGKFQTFIAIGDKLVTGTISAPTGAVFRSYRS